LGCFEKSRYYADGEKKTRTILITFAGILRLQRGADVSCVELFGDIWLFLGDFCMVNVRGGDQAGGHWRKALCLINAFHQAL